MVGMTEHEQRPRYPKLITGPNAPYQWRANLIELRKLRSTKRPPRHVSGSFCQWGMKQPEYVCGRAVIESLELVRQRKTRLHRQRKIQLRIKCGRTARPPPASSMSCLRGIDSIAMRQKPTGAHGK